MTTEVIYSRPKGSRIAANRARSARTRLRIFSGLAVIAAALVIGLLALQEGKHSTFIVFGLFLVIGFLIASRQGATATKLFLIVYNVSLIAAVALYVIYMGRYGTPYYIGGSDDLAYEVWGQQTAERLGPFDYASIRGEVVQPSHNSVGYVYLVSLLYRLGELVGGFHTMIPRLFNSLCLGVMSTLTYRLAQRIRLEGRAAVAAALSVGLMPIMVYNAAHTFREIPVALLLLAGVYVWTPKQGLSGSNSRIWRWVITGLLALILSEMRFLQAIALLVVAFLGDVLMPARRSIGRQRRYALLLAIATVALLVAQRASVAGLVSRLTDSQERYAEYRIGLSSGLGAYVFTAPLPLRYVLRLGYALITPLPTLSRDPEQIMLSIGTIVQFLFLPFLGLSLPYATRDRGKWPLLSAFALLLGGMAFVTFTSRHIVQFLPYGVILAATGFERHRRQRIPIWALLGWCGAVLVVGYIVLKS